MAKKATVVAMQESKPTSVLGTFTGKCCDAAVFNNNDMKLNRELFEHLLASDEYKDAIEHGYYIGFLGHPEDPGCQDFKDACIVMTSMEITDDDEIYGTFDLIDTPVGRIVKSFIDAGVQWGISIRGAGDVDAEGNVDPDTFVFRGFDLVAFPAYADAVPEFQQIAASKNLDDQVKFKRVCAAIEKNIQDVNDIHTIEAMQEQFKEGSEQYKKLEAKKAEIGVADQNIPDDDDKKDEECPECTDEDKEEVMGKKIKAMTELYLAEKEENAKLKAKLSSAQTILSDTRAQSRRKIRTLKRITASQQDLIQSKLDDVNASNAKLISANKKLNKELTDIKASNSEISEKLKSANKNNLIYKQKIESSSSDIEAKDAQIAELQLELDKTVVASTNATREASNRGEQIDGLKAKITASKQALSSEKDRANALEDMLAEYQQAYANIYANAIGISVSGLQVTASTSVNDLENLIQGATNTANIGARPSYEEDILLPTEVDNLDDDSGDLAVL